MTLLCDDLLNCKQARDKVESGELGDWNVDVDEIQRLDEAVVEARKSLGREICYQEIVPPMKEKLHARMEAAKQKHDYDDMRNVQGDVTDLHAWKVGRNPPHGSSLLPSPPSLPSSLLPSSLWNSLRALPFPMGASDAPVVSAVTHLPPPPLSLVSSVYSPLFGSPGPAAPDHDQRRYA